MYVLHSLRVTYSWKNSTDIVSCEVNIYSFYIFFGK